MESACRGAINMKIAQLYMEPQDKQRFEIHGKSSVKYHLKANHQVEAKRWYWALNNAIQWQKDEARVEEEKRRKAQAQLSTNRVALGIDEDRDDSTSSLSNTASRSGKFYATSARGKTATSDSL